MKSVARVHHLFNLVALSFVLVCSQAFAADLLLDFDGGPGPILLGGTAEHRFMGGVDDSGYLKITDAINNQRGAIIIGDLDEGKPVLGFDISADLRVGGGTINVDGDERPADGFSFNFARFDDPAITDIIGGGTGIWSGTPDGSEMNIPEEGTMTGIAIGFDEWQSGPEGPDGDLGFDVVGFSLRIGGELIAQAKLPVLNQGDDEQSLQTGPFNAPVEELGWAPLTMRLDPDTNDFVMTWKGEIAFEIDGADVPWTPTAGALVFGGRTGGANSNHHIDNIRIRTFTGSFADCDFNRNSVCDVVDIDLLGKEIIAGTNNTDFDLTDDGLVNLTDQDQWRADAADKNGWAEPYLNGDANLDGRVTALDLNALGGNWNGTPDPWSDGDFNADGNVNAQDLNLLALNWQKSIPAAASPENVPEPSGMVLLYISVFLAALMRLQRNGG